MSLAHNFVIKRRLTYMPELTPAPNKRKHTHTHAHSTSNTTKQLTCCADKYNVLFTPNNFLSRSVHGVRLCFNAAAIPFDCKSCTVFSSDLAICWR